MKKFIVEIVFKLWNIRANIIIFWMIFYIIGMLSTKDQYNVIEMILISGTFVIGFHFLIVVILSIFMKLKKK